mmetsp:Transcript_22833/g.60140  ORF Transcript_22833/g.60140 Transcript_22833/m.60140 type:complete len:82 (+) Transcript_22833:305-550(+)
MEIGEAKEARCRLLGLVFTLGSNTWRASRPTAASWTLLVVSSLGLVTSLMLYLPFEHHPMLQFQWRNFNRSLGCYELIILE